MFQKVSRPLLWCHKNSRFQTNYWNCSIPLSVPPQVALGFEVMLMRTPLNQGRQEQPGRGDELSTGDVSVGRASALGATTPPSTPKTVRFGECERRHFDLKIITPPGPTVAPCGKLNNLKEALSKEWATFLAGAGNQNFLGGGIFCAMARLRT